MKSDGENMNITSIVIIKRVIGFTCVILLLLTNVYAQENEISIDLELVSVWESEYQPSPQGLIKGDTLPEIINFEFIVYNHTDKLSCSVLIVISIIIRIGIIQSMEKLVVF